MQEMVGHILYKVRFYNSAFAIVSFYDVCKKFSVLKIQTAFTAHNPLKALAGVCVQCVYGFSRYQAVN